jgi:hypothetical protein
VIVSVTSTVTGDRPGDFTVTVAVAVPSKGCPLRLPIFTLVWPDPDPDTGETSSHDAFEDAVHGPEKHVSMIYNVCAPLTLPPLPRTAVKLSCVGLTDIVGSGGGGGGGAGCVGAVIVSVTCAVAAGTPGDVTVTVTVTDPVSGCEGRLTIWSVV